VTKKQPFLTGFPTTICGRVRRRLQDVIAAKRKALSESSIATNALQFSKILPADFLDGISGSKRRRHYCNVVVFWAWLAQILEANASCSKAVALVQSWEAEAGLPVASADTGAYCKARSRLKLDFLKKVGARVAIHLRSSPTPEDKFRGLVVKSIDGSSVRLEDTPENQLKFPQPSTQKEGCGFPVMGIVGVLNHAHGGWEDFVTCEGTEHDSPVAHRLLHNFGVGDLACADRAFCAYELIASLSGKGAHSLMRLHQARHRALDWRKGKRLGKNNRRVVWKKPVVQPKGSPEDATGWAAVPRTMEVRLIRFDYVDRAGKKRKMVLATTLLDTLKYPWEELASIYMERWDIELRLRDVKTTMGMEVVRAKSPALAKKTLEMAIIAYNLVRATCQEAAKTTGENVRLMSFKSALDTVMATTERYRGRQKQPVKIAEIWREMIGVISGKVIDVRPGRSEPRAIKRRPKSFSYLTRPRSEYREIPHRGKPRSWA
jgi:hypothetical protein